MRVFIALLPPVEARQRMAALATELRPLAGRAGWVAAANLHITLQFLGQVEEPLIPQLSAILDGLAAEQQTLQLTTTGLGCFPPRGRPRVLYLGTDQQQPLQRLARSLARQLVPLGFALPGHFHAHLTLARLKPSDDPQRRERLLTVPAPSIRFLVDSLSLMHSHLSPTGAFYEELYSSPLAS